MVTIENVRNSLVALWGCNCGFVNWVWEQAAEENYSLSSIWDKAVVRLADHLGVPPEETDAVNDLLDELTFENDLATTHEDSLCEYRQRNAPREDDTWESIPRQDRPALFCR